MSPAPPVVLVTGAGAGIGRACAITLAAQGYHVIAADHDHSGAESTSHAIDDEGGSSESYICDVTDSHAVRTMITSIVDHHRALAGAVNNAGISGRRVGIGELEDDAWVQTRSVNLDAVLYCLREEIRAMKMTGGGSIVNMASILSTVAVENAGAYVATKHAVLGLTRSAALDYAGDDIRVNAVGPGFIDGQRRRDMSDDARQELIQRHPLGRLGSPEDVAALVAFLISDQASNITGSFFTTDGGYTIR